MINQQRLGAIGDGIFINDHLGDILLARQFVHHVQQGVFQNRSQSTRPGLACQGLLGNRLQCSRTDFQFGAFHLQQLGVLLDQGIFWLQQNLDQGLLIQFIERRNHWQTSNQRWNQAELEQIVRLSRQQNFAGSLLGLALDVRRETYAALYRTLGNDLCQAIKRTTTNKHDVGRVNLHEILVRMLAPALWRHRCHSAFDQLEQRLLHAFTGDITGNRWIVRFTRNLVDFIDIDNTSLCLLDFVIAILQQLLNDVLDVFTNVAGFCQGGSISNHKRHIEHACQCLRQQRLARTGWTDQQNIALGQFDIILLAEMLEALVMVVHRYRQNALGSCLTDHILIEQLGNFLRGWQV